MDILREYGQAAVIYMPVIKRGVVDFALAADWTPAAGDVRISKNGGASANVATLPTAITMGNGAMWQFPLSATEMQAADIVVTVVDAATKAVEHQAFLITTYGNASARHRVNLNDGVRAGLTALPNAAAEAAGGLYTRGTGGRQINQDANGRVDTRTAAMAADVMTAAALAADFTVENTAPILAVLGALANAASSGDPNTSNTMVAMLKRLVNTLGGAAGTPPFPAAAAPANAVSLAEVIRQIYTEVQNLDGASLTNLDAAISSRASAAALATVQADTDDLQTRLPAALVGGRMDASVGAMAANVVTGAALDPTAGAEIADAVWDEALAGHLA